MTRSTYALLCVIITSVGCIGAAGASADVVESGSRLLEGGTRMQLLGNAFAPPAFRAFCAREPRLCSTDGRQTVVALDERRFAELASVNRSVNRRIVERDDRITSGNADQWQLPDRYGDCEDFAILKKAELMKRGWPAAALLLTVARSSGEGHTVLTVRTTKGDLVLDNLSGAVRDWSRTPYRYFARQAQGDGRRWQRIGSAKPVTRTARGTVRDMP